MAEKDEIGDVFVDEITVKQGTPTRFIDQSYKLQRVIIAVSNNSVKVGRQGKQTFLIASGGSLTLTNIDLADLYFIGDSGDAIVDIIGTTRR